MSSTKYAVQNLLTRAILIPLGIISSVIIARILGVEGRGVYAYIILLSTFFIPILSFGYPAGAVYEVSTRRFSVKNISASNFFISLLQGALVAVVVLGLWYFGLLGKTGQQIPKGGIAIILSLIFINTLFRFSSKNILADSWFSFYNILEILRKIIVPIMVIGMIIIFSDDVFGGAVGLLVGSLILLLILIYNIWSRYRPVARLNMDYIRRSYAYGIKGWFGQLSVNANTRIDQLILGGIASAEALGNYSIAVMLSELLWLVPMALGQVIYNRIAESKDQKTSLELVKKTHRIVWSFLFVCTLIATLVGPYVIPFVYGSDFSGAILPFLILLPGTLLMVSARLLDKLFTASGYIAVTNKVQIISSIISIILYIILIPRMGILGAAIGASVGYAVGAVLFWYFYKKMFNAPISEIFVANRSEVSWAWERCRALFDKR